MQVASKLGVLPMFEGCHAEFRCNITGVDAVHRGRGVHGAVGVGAAHMDSIKIGSWRFQLQVILK